MDCHPLHFLRNYLDFSVIVICPSVSCRILMNIKITPEVCSGITVDAML